MNDRSHYLLILTGILFSSLNSSGQEAQDQLGRYWLGIQSQPLAGWEWDIDHDDDGFSTRDEYFAGTDPFDAQSYISPSLWYVSETEFILDWDAPSQSRFHIHQSDDLETWSLLEENVLRSGDPLNYSIEPIGPRGFFSIAPLPSPDSDLDGLSDREEAILGTRPDVADTDEDSLKDGDEIFQTKTDPLVFDPLGGTIQGRVVRVDAIDAALAIGTAVAEAMVYLDLDFDGQLDENEPRQATGDGGSYQFSRLSPGLYEVRQLLRAGETQTVPSEVSITLPDRLPDEVLEYDHPAVAAFDSAYGHLPQDDWPGQALVILGRQVELVDPALVLLPFGARLENPPIGSYPLGHHLAIPEGGSVTIGFDEIIYDGPGADFIVGVPTQGNSTGGGEPAKISIGPSVDELYTFDKSELFDATVSRFNEIDLADFPEVPYVQVLKVLSETSGAIEFQNSDGGYGFGGVEAINVIPLETSGRRVRIIGNEVYTDEDFGVFFQDLPPSLLLTAVSDQPQANQAYRFKLFANDDLGIASVSAEVNGVTVALNEENEGTFTPSFPGELTVAGTTTDSGGQTASRTWKMIILDENGDLPFDPADLAEQQGAGLTSLQIFTPAPGDVPETDVPVVASITNPNSSSLNWTLSYALLDDIDPNDLATADPDYVQIASGSGSVYSDSLGTFPTASLADGIYFLKLEAIPSGGGLGNILGQVIGVGVDEATLQPQITIVTPLEDSRADYSQPIIASLVSDRPITTWKAEVAAVEDIELTQLDATSEAWTEVASGDSAFPEEEIGQLDTSLLPNGRYVLRIIAFNDLKLGRLDAVEFEVSSPVKLGRNRRDFTDSDIELVGFPLTVSRTYDSLKANELGDFGYGWSLSLGDPNIFETIPVSGSGIFGATPFTIGARVYLSAPNGQRVAFTFQPELVAATFVGALYKATFVPDPGNPYQLEVPEGDDGFLTINGLGEARLNFIPFPWNPDRYILVDQEENRYTYEQSLGLLSVEDPSGNRLNFSPDGVVHSSGSTLDFARDAEGKITTVTEPGGLTWTYCYSAENDLLGVEGPGGNETIFDYSDTAPHFLTSVTDPFGRTGVIYEYDEAGRFVATIDENGNREESLWDPEAQTGTITDRRGNVTQIVYDNRGNVTQEIDPLGNMTTFVFGDSRHPDIETEISTENTKRFYDLDDGGNVTEVRFGEPLNQDGRLRFTYDGFGNRTTADRVGGVRERNTYNDQGLRVSSPVYNLNNAINQSLTYNGDGQIQTFTAHGQTASLTYAGASGAIASYRDSLGLERDFTYENGRLTSSTQGNGETTTIDYDDVAGKLTYQFANGGTLSTVQESNGEVTTTDALGQVTRVGTNTRGDETSRTLPDASTITQAYDPVGNLSTITSPGSVINAFTYDAANRQTEMTDDNGQVARTTYDAEGRVIERVNRNGKRITYELNQLGQVTAERWHEGDEVVREFVFSYRFSSSALFTVTDGSSIWELSARNIGGYTDSYTWRFAGQARFFLTHNLVVSNPLIPSSIKLNDEADLYGDTSIRSTFLADRPYGYRYNFDDSNADASVKLRYNSEGYVNAIERFDFSFTPDFFAAPVSASRMTYLPLGVLGSIRHEDSEGNLAFPEASFDYTRDLQNRIVGRSQPGNASVYGYDATDQLTSATHSAFANESFAYTVGGNRVDGTYGPGNRLLTLGTLVLDYDNEGNVVTRTDSATGEVFRYTYDHRNQLTEVTKQANGGAPVEQVAAFEYDYRSRMMWRAINGQKTWIIYDRDTPLAEFNDGEDFVSTVHLYDLADPERKFGIWKRDQGVRWFLTDQIGTVNGLVDHQGAALHWVDYGSYGLPRMEVPADFGNHRFAGQFYHPDTGLYENALRHYNPELRRFQQQDPIREESGDYNFYRYANNNPVSGSDPTGTNSALEYAHLISDVVVALNGLKDFGECLSDLLEGAADGIAGGDGGGGGGGGGVGCVGETLPGIFPLGPIAGPVLTGLGPWPGLAF